MPTSSNSSLMKRKNCIETKAEPVKKALKKAEILQEYQVLQKKYDALEERHIELLNTNKENIEAIRLLEETVQILESKSSQKATSITGTQTEDMERMWCIECEFPAEDLYELGEHMYEIHAEENAEYEFSCHHCGNFFKSEDNLMAHDKKNHIEKVQPCKNYLAGECDYGDQDCWFIHDLNLQKSSREYTCSFCKKGFILRSDLMLHKKQEHKESVSKCKNTVNCQYVNCWYIHSEQNITNGEIAKENEKNTNQDISEKLFDMIENLSGKITELQNRLR